ncbi:MAG: DHA2 family multidrug resistance protein [Gammaproteobacteria bacterium]|jgi:DHA2 family multidrug resistance protein
MATPADSNIDDLMRRFGPSYRWFVTFTVMLSSLTMGLASTMVNVAVPSVMGAYGVGLDQAQWMATGFLATMSATMLLSSWLIEVLGQRITFAATLIVFAIGSLLSGVAQNMDVLVIGRVLQGAASGVGQPLAMFSIFSVFPPERRGTALGIYGLGSVLAPTFGPIVAGLAIDNISWRYLFFLPLPLCAFAFMLGLVFMPWKRLANRLPPFDWVGFTLVLVIMFSLLGGLANGPRWGWDSDAVLLRLLTAALLLPAFIFWELRAAYPLLDLGLFKNYQFSLTMVTSFAFGVGLFSSGYFIPVFVQTIQNYNATEAGFLLAPGGLVMMLFFPLAGRITDTIPAHIPISTGLFIFAIGFFLIHAIDVDTTFWLLVGYTAITRVGLSLCIPSLNVAALRAVPPEKLARGASTSTFFRNTGGGIGIAVLTAFFQYRTQLHGEAFAATQTSANHTTMAFLEATQRLLDTAGVNSAAQALAALNYLSQSILAQASTLGFKDTFLAIAIMSLLATIPALLLGNSGRGKPGAT